MADNFDSLWSQYIKSLVGKQISTIAEKKENEIVEVTEDYLRRLSSRGNVSPKIPKTLFKEIYNRLLKEKIITRTQINNDYQGRRSSIVVAILKELPNIEAKSNPVRLIYSKH